ncbi:MAG: SDR family oxidoreductase [Deltaproteobacteria bacterium]|nr:SDR family oxidoreductase [Deltaproteobacteria bacterium]
MTQELSQRGCRVVTLCRDMAAAHALSDGAEGPVDIVACDLSSQASIRAAAAELVHRHPGIDVLVHCAAVVYGGPRRFGADGHELQLSVNHLAPYLLTRLLLPALLAAPQARILTVSSRSHRRGRLHRDDLGLREHYALLRAYRQSKLLNVLFTRALAARLTSTSVRAWALCPGMVRTGLAAGADVGWVRHVWWCLAPFQRPPEKVARSLADLVRSEAGPPSGSYLALDRATQPSRQACSTEAADWVWRESASLVGLPEELGAIHSKPGRVP